jgi:hypothetical protein
MLTYQAALCKIEIRLNGCKSEGSINSGTQVYTGMGVRLHEEMVFD